MTRSILILLAIAIAIMLLPLCTSVEWKDSIAYAGSLASVGAIAITLWQVSGIRSTNEAIKDAIEENNTRINRLLTVAEISRHIQMVHEIKAYILASKFDAAHIRLSDMQVVIDKLYSNYKSYNLSLPQVGNCLRSIKDDLKNLNKVIHGQGSLDGTILADHLDEITPILSAANEQLQKIR